MLAVWNWRAFRVLISSNSRRGTYTGFLRNPPAGVHHENKRKNRGRKMEETDPLVCSAWLHHVSSCTTRNNRGNISPPIYPWKILPTAMTMIKSFRFFRFFLLWKWSLFYRSSFDFIISIYYESVWISILFFYLKKNSILYIMIELCEKINK